MSSMHKLKRFLAAASLNDAPSGTQNQAFNWLHPASPRKARHKTLSEFLAMLGLEAKTIADGVEDIEHHLRPQTLEVIDKLVSY